MKQGAFRLWCIDKWYEHCEELRTYGEQLNYDSTYYFTKYKYWLKREYKHQQASK